MKQIPFQVSARTARLIGRENVANADGAIIELVKNCYDADAQSCIVYFDNKYCEIPEELSAEQFQQFSDETKEFGLIQSSYIQNGVDKFTLSPNVVDKRTSLSTFFSGKCSLYIIDNGCGMDDSVIMNYWMMIGTDNKEIEYITDAGRIKTGAKGIGRFALDRLGITSEMYTLPKVGTKGYCWKVNWKDFEKEGAAISEIKADLDEISQMNLKTIIQELTENFKPLSQLLEMVDLSKGTVIKISQLRDTWDDENVKRIFENLEILVPPKEQPIFSIELLSSFQGNEYGSVESHICDDFDYKVTARYLDTADKKIEIMVERNELDIELIGEKYMDVFNMEKMGKPPFDYETFKKGNFTIEKSIYELVKGFKDVGGKQTLDKIGKFDFTYYYLKNMVTSKEKGIYPYKNISSASRKAWLDRFGGVKIFRDNFRIRPYGENGNDWLGLGERQAQSPGGAGHIIGGYRIRPNQISGAINISRIANQNFQDKSGREGIQENDAFSLFKEIIIGLIEVFEKDRNNVMYTFSELYDARNEKEESKRNAKEIAEKTLEEESQDTKNRNKSDMSEDKIAAFRVADEKITKLAIGYQIQEREIEEKENELRLIRALASTGLIVTSFTHELKNLRSHLIPRTEDLKEILKKLIDLKDLKLSPKEDDPFRMLSNMREQDIRLKHWLDFSLSALKRDKRKRVKIDLIDYFKEFKDNWKKALDYRNVSLRLKDISNAACDIRAFTIDLDSIFNNLLVNSLDAFKRDKRKDIPKREILITCKYISSYISIIFEDTGPGLSEDFKDPQDIFLPFETSKRNKLGNKIGTGIGMYLVKAILEDYDAEIKIMGHENGFKVEILFPIRKEEI